MTHDTRTTHVGACCVQYLGLAPLARPAVGFGLLERARRGVPEGLLLALVQDHAEELLGRLGDDERAPALALLA